MKTIKLTIKDANSTEKFAEFVFLGFVVFVVSTLRHRFAFFA
jgi:hypothetical protein